ncbi:MAG: ATP synthase F1 subunit epsilon [Actinomycetia bacterium]|nr:ATP synthase F1 subunit epsilon [Actinomycetes bacterium]MCP4084715.1 ATP synthase F1 subunit epsilon [Actinomycetes bacterium]
MPLTVELVSPEDKLFSGEADMVVARTKGGGDIAFQPGHVPFIGSLEVWSVELVQGDGSRETIAVHQGFVSLANDKVTVLSDVAELASSIDVGRAQAAKQRAEGHLGGDADNDRATAALRRADLRLRVAGVGTA